MIKEMLGITCFILGIVFDLVLAKVYKGKKTEIFGYRVHHTIDGLIFIVLGLFFSGYLLIPLGIGIIISHTIRTKEFVFVELKKKKRTKK